MLASSCLMILGSALCAGAYGAGGSTQGMFAALIVYRFIAGVRRVPRLQLPAASSRPPPLFPAALERYADALLLHLTARHRRRVPKVRACLPILARARPTLSISLQWLRRVERGYGRGGHQRPRPTHALHPQHQHCDRRWVRTRPESSKMSSSSCTDPRALSPPRRLH